MDSGASQPTLPQATATTVAGYSCVMSGWAGRAVWWSSTWFTRRLQWASLTRQGVRVAKLVIL